jgi:thiamine biosynthesis lipoprotein
MVDKPKGWTMQSLPLARSREGLVFEFEAMACPCEARFETEDPAEALRLGLIVQHQAERIEATYSRYREGSLLSKINSSGGAPVVVDDETASLLDYAAQCHALSDGLFDITSGVLRRAWGRFDGSDRIPDPAAVEAVLPLVGWDKVVWRRPEVILPAGMEIDFGGFGKEYAVDRAAMALARETDLAFLVNFGGDLRVGGRRRGDEPWPISLESVEADDAVEATLEVASGGLATSGDARRFLMKDGVRYSHILDPRTGWPVKDPPRSVTVAAPTCLTAGLLSTLAMLKGQGAEAFLEQERVEAWWIR